MDQIPCAHHRCAFLLRVRCSQLRSGSGTAVVIIRSAEPQMQRTAMLLFKTQFQALSLKPITIETCAVSQPTARGHMVSRRKYGLGAA